MRPIITLAAAIMTYTLGSSPMMAEQAKAQAPQSIQHGGAAPSAEPQMPHQTVGQAGQSSAPTRATGWTRARLEAAKKHWAEDQARFKECAGELDSLKKKSKRWMSYHRQGHYLEKCMKAKHPA